jgi:hypothetical protein
VVFIDLSSAVLTAFAGVELIKRFTSIKSIEGSIIAIPQKTEGKIRFRDSKWLPRG